MNPIVSAATLVTAVVSMTCCFGGERRVPLADHADVVVAAPSDPAIQHLAWPKIVRAKNGTLVLAYSAGVGHNRGASGLAISLSEDDGHTFSEPELLCYFPKSGAPYRDVGNLALGIGDDGVLLLLAMAFDGDKANTILGWRSADHGKSWQATDTTALGNSETGSVFGHVFAVPGRGLAVYGHFRKPQKDFGIWHSYSSDNGTSWRPPQRIASKQYFEPVFVHTGGKLVGLVRENSAHAYHQFVSNDLGESWEFTKNAIQGDAKAGHPSPFLTVDPNNPKRLYALVSQRAPAHRITLWEANCDDLRWRRIGLVAEQDRPNDWTYPWMTHLEGNDWYLVYYQGTKKKSSIYGAKISIPSQGDEPKSKPHPKKQP